jgi:hypothetical protein
MTPSQNAILNQVKAFVLETRSTSSERADSQLIMPNVFRTGERAFLTKLARDLHLILSWGEYDEEGQNLAVLLFPGARELPLDEQDSGSEDEVDSMAAVDRALREYDEVEIIAETLEDDLDSQEGLRLQQKMGDWKRAYYRVRKFPRLWICRLISRPA